MKKWGTVTLAKQGMKSKYQFSYMAFAGAIIYSESQLYTNKMYPIGTLDDFLSQGFGIVKVEGESVFRRVLR